MTIIRVLIAEDHPAVRAGIRSLLETAPDIVIAGETGNGRDALRLTREISPDVLLLDIEMPGLTGVEVARRLQAAKSPVRILVLSAYDDREYVHGMLASGAAGYLTKEEAPELLLEAVRRVSQGEEGWLSRRASRSVQVPKKRHPDMNIPDTNGKTPEHSWFEVTV
jgi:DNA-binding NarL/FixJ family response regulator